MDRVRQSGERLPQSLGSDTITHSAVSPQTTAKLEAAHAAKETRVDVDAERFVDLSAPMAQARKDDPDRQRTVHRSSDGSTPANPSGFGAMVVPSPAAPAFAAPSPSPAKAKAKPPKMVVKVSTGSLFSTTLECLSIA